MSWGLGPGRDVPPAPKSCAPAKPITPAAIPATGPKTVPTAVSTSVAICSAPLFHAPDSKHGPGRWKRRLHHAAQPQMGVDKVATRADAQVLLQPSGPKQHHIAGAGSVRTGQAKRLHHVGKARSANRSEAHKSEP